MFGLFLIIIWIFWFLRLDDVDKLSIKYFILSLPKRMDGSGHIITFDYLIHLIVVIMMLPFRSSDYLGKVSEGVIYSGNEYDSSLVNYFDDKMNWVDIFEKWDILHPKLIMYRENGKDNWINDYELDKDYIKKPIHGRFGIGVELIPGSELVSMLMMESESESESDYLVQERLYDCGADGHARHFRVITTLDKSILCLFMN